MYPNLKLCIFKLGMRQNQLAKQLGMSDAALSKIINGYKEPSPAERKMIAGYLGETEEWLFEKFTPDSGSGQTRLHAVPWVERGQHS